MVGARLSKRGKQAGARPPGKDAPREREAALWPTDDADPQPTNESAKVEQTPPEVSAADDGLSPDEAERIRKSYLLKRFWISARGFWGRHGDRIAWLGSLGLLVQIVVNLAVQYGINVWNREIFDAI